MPISDKTQIAEPEVNEKLVREHNITPEEYNHIEEILGRKPNFTELGIFSVMWSEHCSYKNSRPVLKLFPVDGPSVLVKAGEENAGVVDIGDGWAVSFKVESHNHPSAIEPFQGAATGVGGIIRDIFTMGARPIASLNSLRFGKLANARVKHLLKGVVGGIAHYGNCIGIPTVGGEIYFDETYEANPLVNAFCLGIIRHKDIARGCAKGEGNPVFYVGAATGRDGLGGASFASRELTDESHEDRPAVQVGDPFMEKLLLEACLELLKTGYVVGIQDMGAAGLTCSTCETASRGGSGIEIELSKVPKRETGMIPYEIMLSESQERMLVIAEKGKEKEVKKIFEKWDLHAVEIGHVTGDGIMRVRNNGNIVVEIPARKIAEDSPVYIREEKVPAYLEKAAELDEEKLEEPGDYNEVLARLLDDPTISSKKWVYEQYDHMVMTNTVLRPGSDAAVLRVKPAGKYLALSSDCNSTYCYLDPYTGGRIAVAESARNVICSGAKPIAVTDCLNFGNPMKPEIFWQFKKCVEGLADACRSFNTPVTGGNVSFYNENPRGPIDPTPVVCMVGLFESEKHITGSRFTNKGDLVYLIGGNRVEIGGSQYLKNIFGMKKGKCPVMDLEEEKAVQSLCYESIKKGLIRSAHDCSEGGLAVALAECCIMPGGECLGACIDLARVYPGARSKASVLFGESQSRIIVTVAPENAGKFDSFADSSPASAHRIGTVKGKKLVIKFNGDDLINSETDRMGEKYFGSIGAKLKL
ncbi:phosphoribosylformylglycinamidine synthase subunit PurL [bacterium]|jgi:phosphoribosylformylglycinamidine synthase|nr:phosphoribosylformylglycinamidine synthase subunit PurL [bacterium]